MGEVQTIPITKILSAIKDEKKTLENFNGRPGIFVLKTGNQWLTEASSKAQPKSLYLCVWYESEVCILFADTNVGKSILAVQIASDIAKEQKVIYIDFELSDKQFEARYSQNLLIIINLQITFYEPKLIRMKQILRLPAMKILRPI